MFVEVDDYFACKCEAMNQYKTELREFHHLRSIEEMTVLAKKKGSVIGANFLEAFNFIRRIDV